ncbi:phage portal protein [[Clostridium] sordellii]|nr:phage portal protein [[Clostridium] sordellii] [Paeniclostridium sordellii]
MKDIFTDITKQIASVFNINPYMIGHDGTSNTYSNIENQNIQYLQQTLMPLIISWEEQLIKLFPKNSPLSVKFNYESLLRADSSSRANRLKTLVDAKIMTIEEARKIEGLQGNGNKKAM